MKTVADTLGVSRSNLVERLKGRSKPRGSYRKAEDAELPPIIRRLVDQRPTYGYRGSPRSSIARGEPPISLSSTPNGFTASWATTLCCWRSIRPFARAAFTTAK